MQVSGVIRFDALTKAGQVLLSEFEQKNLQGIQFTFGPLPGRALMVWDSSASLPEISHLIDLISSNRDLFERRTGT